MVVCNNVVRKIAHRNWNAFFVDTLRKQTMATTPRIHAAVELFDIVTRIGRYIFVSLLTFFNAFTAALKVSINKAFPYIVESNYF